MKAAIGLAGAFGLFGSAFALHIVGGASGQRWLFAIAVALIYLTATGFAAISLAIAGFDRQSLAGRRQLAVGTVPAVVFTSAALWAANGRAFAAWNPPLTVVLVLISTTALLAVLSHLRRAAPKAPLPA